MIGLRAESVHLNAGCFFFDRAVDLFFDCLKKNFVRTMILLLPPTVFQTRYTRFWSASLVFFNEL